MLLLMISTLFQRSDFWRFVLQIDHEPALHQEVHTPWFAYRLSLAWGTWGYANPNRSNETRSAGFGLWRGLLWATWAKHDRWETPPYRSWRLWTRRCASGR